jgi:hypothetical protein
MIGVLAWRVLLLPLVVASVAGLGARLSPPQAVLVVGTDYAFQVPEHIRPGETLFTFENRGTVRHEMSIVLLKEGFESDSVVAAIVAGSPRRNHVDGQGALIVARPGDPPGPRLWMNLQTGRRYLVLCVLKDTPEAKPHVMLGMVATIRVE